MNDKQEVKELASAVEKMQAYKHSPEIIGINLEYAIETYDLEDWRPMTSNGITVTGFWDLRKGDELPEGYEMDLSGRFLKMKNS